MSDLLTQMTDSFRRHRDDLKRQLDMLESGEFGVGDQIPDVVAIEDTKCLVRSLIDELDRLIVDYDPRLANSRTRETSARRSASLPPRRPGVLRLNDLVPVFTIAQTASLTFR
jgi:hypothetical protein